MKQNMNFPSKIEIDSNVPMSEFTRIKIGGKADYLAEIFSQKGLIELVKFCRQNNIRIIVLGEGSNVFFSDSGFPGLIAVIKFKNLKITSENIISVEAGASLSSMNEFCLEHQFTGFEFSSGIPGTIGGAIYGNAGAYGKNVGECLSRAKILMTNGEIRWVKPEDLNFAYRYSAFKDNQNIILEAEFRFPKGETRQIRERVDEILKIREQKLPPQDVPCAGSYFKNLKDKLGNPIAAAKYLDAIGSKNISVGDAAVYHKHANIIINKGRATAKNVLELERILKTNVKDKFNVDLEREVIYITQPEQARSK